MTLPFAWLLLLLPFVGCSKSNDIDLNQGANGNNDQSLPDCAGGSGPGLHGPAMAHVGRLGGGCFWVDATEVSRGQYAEMLAKPPANVTSCDGQNPSFSPISGIDMSAAELPVSGVDWCDAAAFCSWAGKRLCGTYKTATGTASEIQSVCTDGEDGAFRFADEFSLSSKNCQGGADAPSPIGSHPSCVTPTGVFDLAGNVREWTLECLSVGCVARGGSYASISPDDFGCKATTTIPLAQARADLGFRCCADDVP